MGGRRGGVLPAAPATPTAALSTADAADTAAQPCYDARGVTRMYDHLTAISTAMNGSGWSNYANDHEDGNGQFEQNFQFADALTTADRVVTLRYLLSMIAAERGMVATFMPKPFADRTGSGLHLHLSLTSGGTPVFPADDDDPRASGLSDTAYAFIGGILEHACALQAVVAPTVNSYKRTGATTHRIWCVLGAAAGRPTAATTARTTSGCPTTSASNCAAATARPTRTSAIAAALWARASTGSSAALDPGAVGAPRALALRRRRCCTRSTSWRATRWSPACSTPRVTAWPATSPDIKRDEFFAYHSTVDAVEVDSYLDRVLNRRKSKETSHVRDRGVAPAHTRAAIPGSVNCSPECCARWRDRGSDSAGVAVYGDPIWSPPAGAASRCSRSTPTADDLGLDVDVTRRRRHVSCWTADAPLGGSAGGASAPPTRRR